MPRFMNWSGRQYWSGKVYSEKFRSEKSRSETCGAAKERESRLNERVRKRERERGKYGEGDLSCVCAGGGGRRACVTHAAKLLDSKKDKFANSRKKCKRL